jgi:hypothetical protein
MRSVLTGRWRLTSLTAAACAILGSAALQVTTAGPAAAIPGLQTVVVTSALQSEFPAITQDANCPAGLQVIGGGGSIGGNASDKVFLTESYPLDGGRTWRVRAEEVAPGWDGWWWVTTYAICSNPLPGWEIQRGNSGPGVADFKTTFTFKCSQHKKVFSAGGRVNAATGQVGLTMIRPDGPLTIGRASARVAPGGFWDDWSVDSFAICANPVPNQQNVGTIWENSSVAAKQCPDSTTANGLGGGGGTVDLGPYYLQGIAPNRARNGVDVKMTGVQNGGTMAQVTCSD